MVWKDVGSDGSKFFFICPLKKQHLAIGRNIKFWNSVVELGCEVEINEATNIEMIFPSHKMITLTFVQCSCVLEIVLTCGQT